MNDKAFASPSLPVELIVEIGRQTLRLADKKSLRLTCSFLGIEFKPHVLSTVTLDIYLGNTDCGLGLLETLVEDSKSEQSTVCKYIRTLYVDSLSPSTEPLVSKSDVTLKNKEPKPRINFWSRSKSVSDSETAEKRLRLLLEPALKALHNLDTLRWHWELQDSEWAYHTILASISTSALSKNIKEFGFRHDGSFSTAIGALTLPNLPQLRKLSLDGNTISQVTFNDVLSNYELETLHIFRHGSYFSLTDRCLPTSIADLGLDGWYIDVPRIIHNNLTSLYLGDIIEYDNSASDDAYYFTREDAFNSLWDSLRLEHVQLRNLAAPFRITDALLDYITSYSGLESLSLISYRDWYVDGDNASRFYKRALPMHRSTLTKLELTPEHEDEWCFGTENVEVFSLMKRLRYLSVGIHTRGLDPDPLELPGHSIYHKDGNFPNLVASLSNPH
ncbi:hypothetical protein J3R30DRAFT_1351487 [Lentinula aciculospora]|uniref:Uncharacterized protein n=1 Tax=Lentinula aciculospora TaxID=153920 RepID=A0A9W9AP32_9AGAR|nr:hypothetical protein J3R30DRAFT_1351487 [Lentinula aciculospora]